LDKVPIEEMVPQVRALHFVLCAHLPTIGIKLANMPAAKVPRALPCNVAPSLGYVRAQS
jgi:hypothetical protein